MSTKFELNEGFAEELARRICENAPHPGGGSYLIWEDVLDAVKSTFKGLVERG